MQLNRKKIMLFLITFCLTIVACGTVSNNGNSNNSRDMNNAESNTSNEGADSIDSISDVEDDGNNASDTSSDSSGFNLENPALFIDTRNLSYLINFTYNFNAVDSNGENIYGSVRMSGSHTVSPEIASEYDLSFSGLAQKDVGYFHFVEISDKIYFYNADSGCTIIGTDDFNNPLDIFSYNQVMFVGTSELKNEDLEINGVLTKLYRIKNENLSASHFNPGESIDLISGMLWVAPEGYMVKLELDGTGTNTSFTGDPELTGSVFYNFNFTVDSNPAPITIPEECNQP